MPALYNVFIYASIFWIGSVITSFICLVVDRLPHQLNWRDDPEGGLTIWSPPSRCNNCNINIKWIYLIPILGFLLSKGKCPECGVKIPYIYPVVEFFSAIACVVIAYFYGIEKEGLWIMFLFLVLLFLTLIDINETWLPFVVTIPLFWLGLLFSPFEDDSYSRILGSVSGFCVFYFSMFLVSVLHKEDLIAGGDIVFATAAGAWLGMDKVLLFIFISAVTFILYSLPYRLKGIRFAPMGPSLSIGFFLCLL
ncbi:prepilin peptidase [Escherichia coli]|nr:type IV leader peptidase family protein [Escherichia coli DEC6C]MBB9493069.1 prepilin peptidase [Escherichia coli]HAL9882600.1 prepilin peptidase [Escherichia coli]